MKLPQDLIKLADVSCEATNRMFEIFKAERQGKTVSREDEAFKEGYLKMLKKGGKDG